MTPARRALARALERAPAALFALALLLTAFALGMVVERTEAWPYGVVADAIKTARTLREASLGDPLPEGVAFVDTPPSEAAAARVRFAAADRLADPVLVQGGRGLFADLCPDAGGCLAVEYAGEGEVVHAWPYRLDEFPSAAIAELPYEHSPAFSFGEDAQLVGIARLPGGDLLVTLHFEHSYPYGGGIARVGPDGRPRWYRKDYAHHLPSLAAGGRILAPGIRLHDGPVSLEWEGGSFLLGCGTPWSDAVRVLDGDGRLLEEIALLDAIAASPWAPVLSLTSDPCNPLHLNYVHEIEDGDAASGLAAGDLVVSFRNVSAFAVLDGGTREVKRLVSGTFHRQHSVRHLGGARFAMFDNGNRRRDASRLLVVDLATGEETTVFPNEATPERLRNLFSFLAGHLSISPDGERAIVTFTRNRVAVEVRLADGEVLTEFRSIHDVSALPAFPGERAERAALFHVRAVYYAGGE